MTTLKRIDEWGRVILSEQGLLEAFYKDVAEPQELIGRDSPEVIQYNDLCRMYDKTNEIIQVGKPLEEDFETYHARRQSEWLIPSEYQDIDIREYLISRCTTDDQKARVQEELDLMKQFDIQDILHVMIYIVDILKKANVVWGVGRGSSVASYCLYLIGIHRVDSMKYGLDIREFLKC